MSEAGKRLVKAARSAKAIAAECQKINDAFRDFRAAVGDRNAREWLYGSLDFFQRSDADIRRFERAQERAERASEHVRKGAGG